MIIYFLIEIINNSIHPLLNNHKFNLISFFSELEALIFLHACNYSIEKAKICMDTYHTTRTHCPEFFANRDVNGSDVQSQMKIL